MIAWKSRVVRGVMILLGLLGVVAAASAGNQVTSVTQFADCSVTATGRYCPGKADTAYCPTPYNAGDYYCTGSDRTPTECGGINPDTNCVTYLMPASPDTPGGCGAKQRCDNGDGIDDGTGHLARCGQTMDFCNVYFNAN